MKPSWSSRRGTAAMEWVPFGNRSANAEYFFDKRNEEVGNYRKTLSMMSRFVSNGRLDKKLNLSTLKRKFLIERISFTSERPTAYLSIAFMFSGNRSNQG
jgi:hypothetical protein